MHVTDLKTRYDLILGRDLLASLGIELNFSDMTMKWGTASLPMRSIDAEVTDSYFIHDSMAVEDSMSRLKEILDAKYEPITARQLADQCAHLDETKRNQLEQLFSKFENLFDGTLGKWHGGDYDIELKPDVKPYHAKPFPIPRIHERTLRVEVDSFVAVGVHKKVNHSEWAAPIFIIPKKDGSV